MQFYWTLLRKIAEMAIHNNTRVYCILSASVNSLLPGTAGKLRNGLACGREFDELIQTNGVKSGVG